MFKFHVTTDLVLRSIAYIRNQIITLYLYSSKKSITCNIPQTTLIHFQQQNAQTALTRKLFL